MERSIEQRASMKICLKLNKTPTETLKIISDAYGKNALSKTEVKWLKIFRKGYEDIYDEQSARYPSTSHTDLNVQKVLDVLIRSSS